MRGGGLDPSKRRESIWTDKLKKQKIGMNEDKKLDLNVSMAMSLNDPKNEDPSEFIDPDSPFPTPQKDLVIDTKEDASSHEHSPSRFNQDFEQMSIIGHGGFGAVYKAKNKLDGNWYAVKRMVLDYSYPEEVKKILSEVKLLSQFSHDHIVRYYQAWTERIPQHELEQILEGDSEDSSYYLEE